MPAPVTIVARREAELEETARLVRDEGVRCELAIGDVTEPGIAERAVAHTEATLGPVDLLVANAGVLGPCWRASRVTARGHA